MNVLLPCTRLTKSNECAFEASISRMMHGMNNKTTPKTRKQTGKKTLEQKRPQIQKYKLPKRFTKIK